ncbi:MAG: TIGR02328 family protein [Negativicutes bacterium]|nr:TIGR02328 family protein [Negativicutes bacterium]
MRLWHYRLIPRLSRARLLGQHRECCALRGLGWGRRHATVDYVFRHSPRLLVNYHRLVMAEMVRRGYRPAAEWASPVYRGRRCPPWTDRQLYDEPADMYPEHDRQYWQECCRLLADGR